MLLTQVDGSGESSQWPVGAKPRSLSVTADGGHLLITCFVRRQLRLFNDVGVLLRDVDLPDDVACPCHAVQLVHAAARPLLVVFHTNNHDGCQLSVCIQRLTAPR